MYSTFWQEAGGPDSAPEINHFLPFEICLLPRLLQLINLYQLAVCSFIGSGNPKMALTVIGMHIFDYGPLWPNYM